jgi:hypothetical protein
LEHVVEREQAKVGRYRQATPDGRADVAERHLDRQRPAGQVGMGFEAASGAPVRR